MEHRRLKIFFALLAIFAFGVIVWYFLFSQPTSAPTLDQPTSPFSLRDLPARFSFIFQGGEPESTSTTEITLPGKEAFVKVWDKPATGNVIAVRQILKEVTATSTVGTTTIASTKTVRATSTTLMFVDRITGYVYGYEPDSGRTYQISNTTVPGIYDAYIFNNGTKIVMRYLGEDKKSVISILASIPSIQPGNDPEPLANSTYLPQNISSVAVSSDGSELSYVVPNSAGATFYTITSKGITTLATSPFSEWTLTYGGRQVYATPKSSAYLVGSTVTLPAFLPVVNNKTGLASAGSPSGALLNSMWSQNGLVTFGTLRGVSHVSQTKTLASKCTPINDTYFICGSPLVLPQAEQGLPDDWYQGRVGFNDQLVIVNAANGDATNLYTFDEKLGDMDVTHISTFNAGELISFIRKQDGSLYLLNTALLADSGSENEQ